jgi:hypothetical protein
MRLDFLHNLISKTNARIFSKARRADKRDAFCKIKKTDAFRKIAFGANRRGGAHGPVFNF